MANLVAKLPNFIKTLKFYKKETRRYPQEKRIWIFDLIIEFSVGYLASYKSSIIASSKISRLFTDFCSLFLKDSHVKKKEEPFI